MSKSDPNQCQGLRMGSLPAIKLPCRQLLPMLPAGWGYNGCAERVKTNPEGRGQRSEVRSQRSEVRGQKSEVRIEPQRLQPTGFRSLISDLCPLTSDLSPLTSDLWLHSL